MRQLHSLSTNNYSQYPGLSPGLTRMRAKFGDPGLSRAISDPQVAMIPVSLVKVVSKPLALNRAGRERGWAVKADNNGY
jgi:hypothetical protein